MKNVETTPRKVRSGEHISINLFAPNKGVAALAVK
jgi:hypothetical protein